MGICVIRSISGFLSTAACNFFSVRALNFAALDIGAAKTIGASWPRSGSLVDSCVLRRFRSSDVRASNVVGLGSAADVMSESSRLRSRTMIRGLTLWSCKHSETERQMGAKGQYRRFKLARSGEKRRCKSCSSLLGEQREKRVGDVLDSWSQVPVSARTAYSPLGQMGRWPVTSDYLYLDSLEFRTGKFLWAPS